jgi:nucleoside-diphosphate-sugar epimerase
MLKNKKILVTGATGQVARPISEFLAKDNEVWCAARFTDPKLRKELENLGIKTATWSLGSDDLTALPKDFNYVVHSAVHVTAPADDFDSVMSTNAEGTGLLMEHCRSAEAFLYISSVSVYKPPQDPKSLCNERKTRLGYHPVYAPTYSIGKVGTEAVVRTLARVLKLPTIIARLGLAYGRAGHGGVPTQFFKSMRAGEPVYVASKDYYYNPIHEEDIVQQVEPLLKAAAVPVPIINWVADEIAKEKDIVEHIGKISGIKPNIVVDDDKSYAGAGLGDPAGRKKITGPAKWGWKAGMLNSLRTTFPDHKFTEAS